jgi:hypothetical protein
MKAIQSKLWKEINLKDPELAREIIYKSVKSGSKPFTFEYNGKKYISREL